eukprot:tig00020960_g16579.t1
MESPLGAVPDALLEIVVQKLGAVDAQRARGACRRLRDVVDRAEWSRISLVARSGDELRPVAALLRGGPGRLRLQPRCEVDLALEYVGGELSDADKVEMQREAESLLRAGAAKWTSARIETRADHGVLTAEELARLASSLVPALLAPSAERAGAPRPPPSPLESLQLCSDRLEFEPGGSGEPLLLHCGSEFAALFGPSIAARAAGFQRLGLPDWCLLDAGAAGDLAAALPRLRSLDARLLEEGALASLAPLAALEELSERGRAAGAAAGGAGAGRWRATGRGLSRRPSRAPRACAASPPPSPSARAAPPPRPRPRRRPPPPPSIRHLELSLWVDGVLGEEEGAALAALVEAAAPSLRRAELLVGGRAGEEAAAAEAARGALRRGGALGARLAESLRPPERRGPWEGAWAA